MKEFLEGLAVDLTNFLIKFLIALLILIIGFKVINMIEKELRKEHKLSKLDPGAKGFIVSFLIIALKVILIVIVLSIIGIPMASLVTIVGSCAVAIGLALQGGLSNIAGGLMILIFKPFKLGDYIATNGMEGTVKSITMFYTSIVTIDNKVIQLPNGTLSNSNIINYSYYKIRRVDLDISVSYNSDIDKVKKVVNKIIDKQDLILKDKENMFKLKEHANSALIFTLRVWTKTENYWTLYYELMETIKKEFDKNKIEIPFNQLDVHMIK